MCSGVISNEVNTSNNYLVNPSIWFSTFVDCTAPKKKLNLSGIWKNEILGSGQQFKDANTFRLAFYRYNVVMVSVETYNMRDIIMLETHFIEFPLFPPVTIRQHTDLQILCNIL